MGRKPDPRPGYPRSLSLLPVNRQLPAVQIVHSHAQRIAQGFSAPMYKWLIQKMHFGADFGGWRADKGHFRRLVRPADS
jgi:hypothetical protein